MSDMQTTSHLLMIRPVNFGFNAETAVNNAFQQKGHDSNAQEKALAEFEGLVKKLKDQGIDVTVINDSPEPYTPDSVFPNNWISFHDGGTVCLYPMYAPNRRLERKPAVLDEIRKKFLISQTVDFTAFENKNQFLEGTGSMVLDRDNKIAYACLSQRTDKTVLENFAEKMGYKPVSFEAVDEQGKPIYHTNVMMCVADRYVVICLDSIRNQEEKKNVTETISRTSKKIIPVTYEQMNHFAGNMLQVENNLGKKFLVMSSQAWNSLAAEQQVELLSFNEVIHSPLNTIELNGGGSARCMIAEVFLKPVVVRS